MATIRPFRAVRPANEYVSRIAALPYDVYTRKEAKKAVEANPMSFLKIDRAETQFPDDTDMYGENVYARARDTLQKMQDTGEFVQDKIPCYYIYALTMNGRTQTGLVCCVSIDDYLDNVVKKHENTREEKELDRIRHVSACAAHTGPIFLAYRENKAVRQLIEKVTEEETLYDFTGDDHVRHQVWKIEDAAWNQRMTELFEKIETLYVADGHHRAASAVKAGLACREKHPDYTGAEEFNYFLSVLFSQEELHIFDYNRVVFGFGNYAEKSFLAMLYGKEKFDIEEMGKEPYRPKKKGEVGMYLGGTWYKLTAKECICCDDPVDGLDVSVLQNELLEPLLGIRDAKTDARIHFVGGIRGLEELVRLVDGAEEDAVAFAMYPTSMEELLAVADAGRLMPPKSTWFEPKLRSGLFIHRF